MTDSQGLTGTETMTIVVGEPFSIEMSPKSGTWVVGDTLEVIGHTIFVLLRIKRCMIPWCTKQHVIFCHTNVVAVIICLLDSIVYREDCQQPMPHSRSQRMVPPPRTANNSKDTADVFQRCVPPRAFRFRLSAPRIVVWLCFQYTAVQPYPSQGVRRT